MHIDLNDRQDQEKGDRGKDEGWRCRSYAALLCPLSKPWVLVSMVENIEQNQWS
jgi:hypothetical protein